MTVLPQTKTILMLNQVRSKQVSYKINAKTNVLVFAILLHINPNYFVEVLAPHTVLFQPKSFAYYLHETFWLMKFASAISYCASEMRICKPARVVVIGADVEI